MEFHRLHLLLKRITIILPKPFQWILQSFREINLIKEGDKDPLDKVSLESYGLKKCLERAKEYIGWDEKRELYKNQKGDLRRGVGLACFSYATGVWPFCS